MSDPLFRLPKAEVIRLLSESKAREESLRLEVVPARNLEEELARKTSDLELSMRREMELHKVNKNLLSQRTTALNDVENWRRMVETERRRADQEKVLREQMQQRLEDMRMMVDVVKMVANHE